jgi:hypothetical protein
MKPAPTSHPSAPGDQQSALCVFGPADAGFHINRITQCVLFIVGFCHLVQCARGSPVLQWAQKPSPFVTESSSVLCVLTHPLLWALPCSHLLGIENSTCVCVFLEYIFNSCGNWVEFLGCVVILFGFLIEAASLHSPTSNAQGSYSSTFLPVLILLVFFNWLQPF